MTSEPNKEVDDLVARYATHPIMVEQLRHMPLFAVPEDSPDTLLHLLEKVDRMHAGANSRTDRK